MISRASRRDFLKASTLTIGASVLPNASAAGKRATQRSGWIDVNVTLGRWPFRRVSGDETPALVANLRANRVGQAWAGSIEGLIHKDLAAANARLTRECRERGEGVLVPFGSINPTLPGWEEDLRRCVEDHRMPGIRLHPNYHGYKLDDPALTRLLRLAVERSLIVQLAVLMEDERMMHPLWRVSPVDLAPLPESVRATPGLRLVLLNALGVTRGERLDRLATSGAVYFELAMLEGVGGVAGALRQVQPDRLLFGSHAPLLYLEAAMLKLRESPVTDAQVQAICVGNARRLMAA